jgi:dCTP deaminase
LSVLSAQSIRRLCNGNQPYGNEPLITPFVERGVASGKSFGLSACTYDCRIAQDLLLDPMPFHPLGGGHNRNYRALASTIERFALPDTLCGSVLDKSSYARVFVTAFNTHLDPGWCGWLTVELVNLGDTLVTYRAGDPVCQIKFEWLDEPTEFPYTGKYNNQEDMPVPSRHEEIIHADPIPFGGNC